LEISSAVSAVAIYCKFAWRDLFDCRERQDSGDVCLSRGHSVMSSEIETSLVFLGRE
jgi:hypothetical protein